MKREEREQLLKDTLLYFAPKDRYVTDEEGNVYYREDVTLKAMELSEQPLPPAEGAEEILPAAYEWHNIKTGHCYVDYVPHLDAKDGYTKTPLYSTLHAQKIADKMVEERLREELMKFLIWENRTHNIPKHIMERILDSYFKYLKSREK